jgi:HAD superfamily hydrolase (TIGR01509 family)
MKPEARIFEMAIEKAGVAPECILFTDDRQENIEAAGRAGIQVLQFRSESQLKRDMLRLGMAVAS